MELEPIQEALRQAGFDEADDELPDFFYEESLPPTGKKARHRAAEVNAHLRRLMAERLG